MDTSKKITLSTVKSFIKKNTGNLFINVKSSFDGRVDGCVSQKKGFEKATMQQNCNSAYTLGIEGAWFVGGSRDHFTAYEDQNYTGIQVYNSCGKFIIAITK